jgi:hypothetical protein
MLILCDSKTPAAAKVKLEAFGEVVDFATEGITYEAISGHPDIFFCPAPSGLIVAPNLPQKYFDILNQHNISYTRGQFPIGPAYPQSARYNTLVTDTFIIQNPDIADPQIAINNPGHEIIAVKQGYVRCNLMALPNGSFITSDRGIEKLLRQHNLKSLYVDPSPVKLNGFDHGFFGGACGFYGNTFFICGSMNFFKEQERIESFVIQAGLSIVELYDGQPLDVGTILFLS